MKKLAIIDTHPIQYNAPVFRLLAERGNLQLKVFYTWGETVLQKKFDPGFGKNIDWDIPLLDGYDYKFVENSAPDPNASSFSGINNPGIIREIDEYQPDFLLVFGWSFKTNLKILRHFKGKIPIIFRGDSTLLKEPEGFSIKKLGRRIFLTWIYTHIDFALYVGESNKQYYLRHGLKEKQLVLAPHAIDNDRFMADEEPRVRQAAAWRRDLNIPLDHTVVLFAGKLEPVKNVGFIIELASRVQEEKLSFVIVGNGPMEEQLKAKAAPLKNIRFVDFQNQAKMPVVYRLGDVLILCSHSETWGLALNEAMACGLPVMASATCGGAWDLIREGENGIMFAEADIKKPVRFLMRLINTPGLKENAGKTSKEIIRNFSFIHIAKAIEAVVI